LYCTDHDKSPLYWPRHGFRRFHLRGLQNVRTEWTLLTIAYNCRTLWQRLLKRAWKKPVTPLAGHGKGSIKNFPPATGSLYPHRAKK
jgi:hypothetical protein